MNRTFKIIAPFFLCSLLLTGIVYHFRKRLTAICNFFDCI